MAADEVSDDKQTCWTMIADAATGDREARSRFCRSYLPLVRAYLGERWRHGPLAQQVDDAAQEVMIECLSSNGPVERADIERPGGFRAFLLGVVRHIAQRFERRVGTDRLLVGESTAIREAPAREEVADPSPATS